MMKLVFDQPIMSTPSSELDPCYVVAPLKSSCIVEEAKRLDLLPGTWCFALVHDEENDRIVLAEVYSDGVWYHAYDDIFSKDVFERYKKEEQHKHTFKAYQKACLAEAVHYCIKKVQEP